MKAKNDQSAVEVDGALIEARESSGNVFADLGLPNAEDLKFKADLIIEIRRIATARDLTQAQVSEITGMDQPRLSKLLRGQFMSCSADKLFDMLNRLGHNVQISVQPAIVKREKIKVGGRTIHATQAEAVKAASVKAEAVKIGTTFVAAHSRKQVTA